jgi:hypothetical protein
MASTVGQRIVATSDDLIGKQSFYAGPGSEDWPLPGASNVAPCHPGLDGNQARAC